MTATIKSPAHGIASVIKTQLAKTVDQVYHLAQEPVAVALSGGVDSCSILAECLRAGQQPVVVSYTPNTHESTDFKMARHTAKNFGLRFVPVVVDMSAKNMERLARYVISLGYTHKVGVECLAPLVEIMEVAGNEGIGWLFTGDQSDGYFALSRYAGPSYDAKQGIGVDERTMVRDDITSERIDAIRQIYWETDKSCSNGVKKIGHENDVRVVVPYRDKAILNSFIGTTWRQVNQPKPKYPIRLAYEEWFDKGKVWVRSMAVNLHKGDSGFGDKMGELLCAQPHLQGRWRGPRGLYAAMARGEV